MATVPESTAATAWQWPADVLEFARKSGLEPYLDPLLEAIRRLFPTLKSVEVTLHEDPGIPDDWYVTFEVRVPDRDIPDYVEAMHAWSKERRRICPMPLVYVVRHSLVPVEG